VVRLRFETDLATSLKASADLSAAVDKIGDNLGIAANEAKKLELAAKRITDGNLGPMDRYNRKVEEHAKLVKAGKLSVDDAEKSLARYRARIEQVGQSQSKTFGPSALQSLAGYASGMFSIGAAVSAISQALRQVEADAQRAADRVFQSFGSFAALQQVSETPQAFEANVAFARSLITRGVVSPDQQGMAADIAGGLVKARLTQAERDIVAGLGERDVLKPEQLVPFGEGAREFRDIFGGDFLDTASKLIQAGQAARVSAADVGSAATRFGEKAKARGISGDQALAAYVALMQTAPNERTAATRVGEFFEGKRKLTPDQQQIFDQQLSLIQSAPGRGVAGRSFVARDPQLRAADALQNVEGELAIAEQESLSEQQTLLNIIRKSRRRGRVGYNWVDRVGKQMADWLFLGGANLVGAGDTAISAAANQPGYAGLNDEERQLMLDYLKRTAEGVEGATVKPPRPAGRQEN
jgi:hypothetical protein